jgi:hypothetical protein
VSTELPAATVHLAGFTLAHALWNVCDFEDEDEVLCPLAFATDGKKRELLRFEDDSQEEAVERAHAHLAGDEALTAWAFAREGLMGAATGPIDVVLVEAWSKGMASPVVFAQAIAPATRGAFALLDAPLVLVGGRPLDPEAAQPVLEVLRDGAMAHDEAANLWDSWTGW